MSAQPLLAPATRRTPRSVIISAWSVPVLVLGQFSMLAIVPVVLVLVGVVRPRSLRAMRPYGVALAAAYAIPLLIWILRSDRAGSLSKDMHPALMVLVVAVALALIIRLHLRKN